MKRDVKPASTNVDQEFTKEIATKARQSGRHPDKTIDEEDEGMCEQSVEGGKEDLIDATERLDSDKVERSKGGGEHGVTICQQFMHVAQNIEESPRHNVATQM